MVGVHKASFSGEVGHISNYFSFTVTSRLAVASPSPLAYMLPPDPGPSQESWPETMQRPGEQQPWLCLGLGLGRVGFSTEMCQLLLFLSAHLTSEQDRSLKETPQDCYNSTGWLWSGQPQEEAETVESATAAIF